MTAQPVPNLLSIVELHLRSLRQITFVFAVSTFVNQTSNDAINIISKSHCVCRSGS